MLDLFFIHLIRGLFRGILGMDNLFRRSFAQIVPNWKELIRQPAALLAEQRVAVGPRRRPFRNVLLGLFSGFGLFLLTYGLRPQLAAISDAAYFWICVALCVAAFFLLRRGGHLELREDGVLIRYRRELLHVPWSLFTVEGEPVVLPEHGTLLPIAPGAVPLISWSKDGGASVAAKPRSKVLQIQSKHQVFLADVFQIAGPELGAVLLMLGQAHGERIAPAARTGGKPAVPVGGWYDEIPETADPPVVQCHPDGLVTLPLTRVELLPGICCNCEKPTSYGFPIKLPGVKDPNTDGDELAVEVPMCNPCRKHFKSRCRLWFWLTFFGCMAVPIMMLIVGIKFDIGILEIFGAIGGLLTLVIGCAIGEAVAKRQAPVWLKRFKKSEGLIALCFRNQHYVDATARALNATPD